MRLKKEARKYKGLSENLANRLSLFDSPKGGGKVEEQKLINSMELAKIIGKSERYIQTLVKSEHITVIKKGKNNTYDLYKVIQEYIEYILKQSKKEFKSLEDEKTNEEIRYKRAKAGKAILELEELEGRMHAAEDVEEMTTDLVLMVRSCLLGLPGKLAVELATVEEETQVAELIKREVYSILIDLSQYEYNPNEYQKRVRERQGGMEKQEEEEDDL